jgi:hypothetical protein
MASTTGLYTRNARHRRIGTPTGRQHQIRALRNLDVALSFTFVERYGAAPLMSTPSSG